MRRGLEDRPLEDGPLEDGPLEDGPGDAGLSRRASGRKHRIRRMRRARDGAVWALCWLGDFDLVPPPRCSRYRPTDPILFRLSA